MAGAYYSNCCDLSLDRGRNSRMEELGSWNFKLDSTGFIDGRDARGECYHESLYVNQKKIPSNSIDFIGKSKTAGKKQW